MSVRIHRQAFLTVPGIIFSMFPTLICPGCWPAYTGLLSAMGLPFVPSNTYLFPATVVFLAIAIAGLGFRARGRHGYGPLVLGIAAAAVVLASKFGMNSASVTYAGAGLLIIASIWNSLPGRAVEPASCAQCAQAETGEK